MSNKSADHPHSPRLPPMILFASLSISILAAIPASLLRAFLANDDEIGLLVWWCVYTAALTLILGVALWLLSKVV